MLLHEDHFRIHTLNYKLEEYVIFSLFYITVYKEQINNLILDYLMVINCSW